MVDGVHCHRGQHGDHQRAEDDGLAGALVVRLQDGGEVVLVRDPTRAARVTGLQGAIQVNTGRTIILLINQ